MEDRWNAFMNKQVKCHPTGSGILNGRTFAVKDVFAIRNVRNSAGNPDWLRTHSPAEKNAPVLDALLNQGACLTGTTHTDELMYSLNGENFHYGTPANPRLPGRIPGGSSSGSAVAVAAGLVDFSLGTDTGGSIRIPSSYCGLFGFRPTHGLVNIQGVIPLSKSFDTVGWMTRDPALLLEVGETLIQPTETSEGGFQVVYFEKEAWSLVEEDTKACLLNASNALSTKSQSITVADEGLSKWADLFRTIQGIEIWQEHGHWIEYVKPTFGPGIAERFQWARTLNKEELSLKLAEREKLKHYLSNLLKDNGLLVIPTSPGEAPLRNLSLEAMEQTRTRTMSLTCIAGLSGFPQVTIPLVKSYGIPVGLSFIANQNQDLKLLKWVKRLTALFNHINNS